MIKRALAFMFLPTTAFILPTVAVILWGIEPVVKVGAILIVILLLILLILLLGELSYDTFFRGR